MVSIPSLWLPIVLSAVGLFFVSFLVWMVFPWHRSDYRALPDEDAAREALGPQNLTPGQYNIPNLPDRKDLAKPEYRARFDEGPVAFMTVLPRGVPVLGKSLGQTIVYYLAVAAAVAYVTGRALAPGTEYLEVFRIAGAVTWLAFGAGVAQDAIWFGRPWSMVVKSLVDALIYALVVAGFFAAFWP